MTIFTHIKQVGTRHTYTSKILIKFRFKIVQELFKIFNQNIEYNFQDLCLKNDVYYNHYYTLLLLYQYPSNDFTSHKIMSSSQANFVLKFSRKATKT